MILYLCGILLCTVTAASSLLPTIFHEKHSYGLTDESRSMKYSEKLITNASSCYNLTQNRVGFTSVVYDGDGIELWSLFNEFRRCGKEHKFCVLSIRNASAGNDSENMAWYSCVSNKCTNEDVRIYFQLQQSGENWKLSARLGIFILREGTYCYHVNVVVLMATIAHYLYCVHLTHPFGLDCNHDYYFKETEWLAIERALKSGVFYCMTQSRSCLHPNPFFTVGRELVVGDSLLLMWEIVN